MIEARLFKVHPRLWFRDHTKHLVVPAFGKQLLKEGIRTIINVAPDEDTFLREFWGEIWPTTYIHQPLTEAFVEVEKIKMLARVTLSHMATHGVLIHCNKGKNRSVSIVACILSAASNGELPMPAIIDRIRKFRPEALDNPAFEKFVREFKWTT